jgi:hypothetical protein
MRLITQNVQCIPEMRQEDVEHDCELCFKQADIIGWQEINLPRYREAVYDEGAGYRHHWGPPGCAEPISWHHKKFEKLHKGHIVLHEQSQYTETRYVTWVILRNRATGSRFAVTNAHYIPGWHGGMDDTAERQRIWTEGNRRHRNLLERFNNRGLPICGTGDFNRHHHPVVDTNYGRYKVRYLAPEHSIDQLYAIGSPWNTWSVKRDTLNLATGRNSDHQGRKAVIELRERVR